jgi:YVTN family beta-propeller protein
VIQISTVTYRVVATIPVGSRPTAIVISPNGKAAYVADSALFGGTPDVEVIKLSTNKVISSIAVGTDPDALAISANGTALYVANQLSNTVSVVDTLDNTVVTVPVNTGPNGIAVKPATHTACE